MARRGWVIALIVAVIAFAVAFAGARALVSDDPAPHAVPLRDVPAAAVTINNLERAGTIKPLRSAAGAPPATTAGAP
jgi:hypothetical protein